MSSAPSARGQDRSCSLESSRSGSKGSTSGTPGTCFLLERDAESELPRPAVAGHDGLHEVHRIPGAGRITEVRRIQQVVDLEEQPRLVLAKPGDVLEPPVEEHLLLAVDAV